MAAGQGTTKAKTTPKADDAKTETTAEQAKKTKALTEAYGAATKRLREQHLAEFNQLRVEEAAKRGVEWTPKPTAEEKAAADLEALLEAHPELRDRFTQTAGDLDYEESVVTQAFGGDDGDVE